MMSNSGPGIRRAAAKAFLLLPLLAIVWADSAQASEADALAISRRIQARHVPYGSIIDPVFGAPDSDQIVSYTRCGDSAIWTGHYLAAEAFRYKVTGSSDALANVKGAIAGIKSLADVTGTNLLARCLVPMNSPYAEAMTHEEQSHGIYSNPDGYFWVGNTSRDQYSGVFFGLGIAYDMVDDPTVRSSIKDLTTRLLDFLRGHNWIVVMPNGSTSTTFIGRADQRLTFLQIGRRVNPDHYSTSYDVHKALFAVGTLAPIALEVTNNHSYYKFNLDYVNLYNLVRLESSSFKAVYEKAYSILRNHTRAQQNAHFNMIDFALNGPDAGRDADTIRMLEEWLQRTTRDGFVDLRGNLPFCDSPDEACSPVPVPQRPTTDFLWQRNPFFLSGGGFGTIEGAGIDYILPYWMARFYGLLGPDALSAP